MEKLWNNIVNFIKEGNNLYYVIGAVVAIVVIIVAINAIIKKRKTNKDIASINESLQAIVEKESGQKVELKEQINTVSATKPRAEASVKTTDDGIANEVLADNTSKEKETKLAKVVEVKPVVHKTKPEPIPEEIKKQSDDEQDTFTAENEEEKLKRPGVIQIYIDNGGKFRFRIKASNNETVGHSQGYSAKASCRNGIKAIQRAVENAETVDTTRDDEYKVTIGVPVFEIYKDNENKFRFRLRSANTQNILASQGYTAKENCFNGIRSIKHLAFNHKIVDDTLKK